MEAVERLVPLVVAWSRLQAETLGHKKCRKIGVGGMMRILNAETPKDGGGPYAAGARADLQLLHSICRTCSQRSHCKVVLPE